MKRYIIYPQLLLVAIIAFTACEEDPVVPKVNYRNIGNTKQVVQVPQGTFDNDFYSCFRFCINNDIYAGGRYEVFSNEEDRPYDGRALYKLNTTNKKWEVVWYLKQKEIDELYQADRGEEADLLRQASEILNRSNSSAGCSFNGKGYVYSGSEMMVEFDPSTSQIKYYKTDLYFQTKDLLFSTTKGVFSTSINDGKFYQYSTTEHEWLDLGSMSDPSYNYYNNTYNFLSQSPDIYIWRADTNIQFTVSASTYPYTDMQDFFIDRPRDYGWNSNYYSTPNYSYEPVFYINGKLYKKNSENSYCEYDLKTQKLTIVFTGNGSDQSMNLQPLCIISNKIYYYSQGLQSIMEHSF